MNIEDYGLTKSEYRDLIESGNYTAKLMAEKIIVPKRVFRYRRLGRENERQEWIESKFWEDDINGIMKFSIPSSFNKNDKDDCKVSYDSKECTKYIIRDLNRRNKRVVQKKVAQELEKYVDSLQQRIKVGCFTTASPNYLDMWENVHFGDEGRGICLEYEVDDINFSERSIPFLPVLYDDLPYDSTEAIKAVIDYAQNSNNTKVVSVMVCKGYGHTIIKGNKYEPEKEWRIVIPVRDDCAHQDYFNVDRDSKRDFTSAIKGIYLGPNFYELVEAKQYLEAIKKKWNPLNVPIYEMVRDGEGLRERLISG